MSGQKLKLLSLLATAFVVQNQELYKDDPERLTWFDGLTESELQVTNITEEEEGVFSAVIASHSRNFEAPDQKWRPAPLLSENTFTLANTELLASEEEARAQTTPGAYSYLTGEGETGYLLVLSADDADVARTQFIESCNYEVETQDISYGEGTAFLDTPYLKGSIFIAVAAPAPVMLPQGAIMDLG